MFKNVFKNHELGIVYNGTENEFILGSNMFSVYQERTGTLITWLPLSTNVLLTLRPTARDCSNQTNFRITHNRDTVMVTMVNLHTIQAEVFQFKSGYSDGYCIGSKKTLELLTIDKSKFK